MSLHYVELDWTDSTNHWVELWARQHALPLGDLLCVVAKGQRAGRGKGYRAWHSPYGQNIYISLYYEGLSGIGNNAWLHARQLLQVVIQWVQEQKIPAYFKPPNDILIAGKKCGGILAQVLQKGAIEGIILGLGINVNSAMSDLGAIASIATSLAITSNHEFSLSSLIQEWLDRYLPAWTQSIHPFI